MKDKRLIVNATALDKSGALSILRQFVENIPLDNRNWLIFISSTVSLTTNSHNVKIVPIDGVKSMHKRLWWDAFGLKKWLKENKIEPEAAISLQNTGFNVGKKVPSYIYYHQPIPFFQYRWNPLKSQERTFWFYKYIYPFFVNLFLKKDSKIFVQLEFIKKGFAKRFRHPLDLIYVYTPSISNPKSKSTFESRIGTCIKFIYPATPHFYKNHRIIIDALKMTNADVSVLFTIHPADYKVDENRIRLIGMQPYERICQLYNECDALLFPSYIETFGLPLLEAALVGMPIIASDLPYAREVLDGYEGVTFVPHNDAKSWALAIESIEKNKRYNPIDISNRPGWNVLFENIKSSL